MAWEDIKIVESDPQSLLGYAKETHRRSGGVCLYCGFGVPSVEDPEHKFDVWRQLTVEHIVPSDNCQLREKIKHGICTAFPDLSEELARILRERVEELNTVTCCHLCNSLVSRYTSNNDISGAICSFNEDLQAPEHPGMTTLNNEHVVTWLKKLRDDIWNLWKEKSKIARGKLLGIRQKFQDEYIDIHLNVPLAAERPYATPDYLDRKLTAIMDEVLEEAWA